MKLAKYLMNIKPIILLTILIIFSSCKQDEIKQIGLCYIQENELIKYLDKTETGDIDTIVLDYANVANFEIINDSLAGYECLNADVWVKDKLSVWYKHYKIIGAEPSTFKILEDSYSQDEQNVFYKQLILTNADKENFKILSNFFAKDEEHIWYKGKEVFGINDPSNFKVIDGYFSSDGNSIFLNNDTLLLKMPDSDVKTFQNIKNDMHLSSLKYYKDKNNVYCIDTEKNIGEEDFMYVFDVFTESFEILSEKYYSKDNFNIYYKNKVMENADRLSFSNLGKNYSKDSTSIFFKNKMMKGIDYETFEVFENDTTDAKDSINFYNKGKKLQNNNAQDKNVTI